MGIAFFVHWILQYSPSNLNSEGKRKTVWVSGEFKLLESLLKKENKMYQHTPPLQALKMHHSEAWPKSQSMRAQSYLRRFTISVFPKEGVQECLLGPVQTQNFPWAEPNSNRPLPSSKNPHFQGQVHNLYHENEFNLVKLLIKFVIIIYALGLVHEQFSVWIKVILKLIKSWNSWLS